MRTLRHTHILVELEVSPATFAEIRGKLDSAGYDHAFLDDNTIDMSGLALKPTASWWRRIWRRLCVT